MKSPLKSGPNTPPAHETQQMNACRPGSTSQTVVMPWGDAVANASFTKNWIDGYQPAGFREIYLVHMIADASWRLNRAAAMETNVIALAFQAREDKIVSDHPEAHAALAIADGIPKKLPALHHLSMHQQRLYKQINATMRELERLQKERKEQEQQDLEIAANLMEMHAANNPGAGAPVYEPAQDGFGFRLPQIAAHIERQTRRRQAQKYGERRLGAANVAK